MALTWRTPTGSASNTGSAPGSTASGDLLVAVTYSSTAYPVAVDTTNWTQIAQYNANSRFWRVYVANGGTPTSYVFTNATANWIYCAHDSLANAFTIAQAKATFGGPTTGTTGNLVAPANSFRSNSLIALIVRAGGSPTNSTGVTVTGFTQGLHLFGNVADFYSSVATAGNGTYALSTWSNATTAGSDYLELEVTATSVVFNNLSANDVETVGPVFHPNYTAIAATGATLSTYDVIVYESDANTWHERRGPNSTSGSTLTQTDTLLTTALLPFGQYYLEVKATDSNGITVSTGKVPFTTRFPLDGVGFAVPIVTGAGDAALYTILDGTGMAVPIVMGDGFISGETAIVHVGELRVLVQGTRHRVYFGYTLLLDVNDAALATGTGAGLYIDADTAGTPKIDDFYAQAVN